MWSDSGGARPVRLFLDRYKCFSLPITNADMFVLRKPQLKDITVHVFFQYVGRIKK